MLGVSWIRNSLLLGQMAVGLVVSAAVMPISHVAAHQGPSVRTFTLAVKNLQASIIDLKPKGPSVGDERVGHAQLYNAQGTEKVGRVDFLFVETNQAAKPGTIALKTMRTFTLPGGTIEIAGVSYRRSITSLAPHDVSAITGGTGKYVGATGQVVTRSSSKGVTETFYLTS